MSSENTRAFEVTLDYGEGPVDDAVVPSSEDLSRFIGEAMDREAFQSAAFVNVTEKSGDDD